MCCDTAVHGHAAAELRGCFTSSSTLHGACHAGCLQVNSGTLERVRKVKTRHQRLLTRVTTIREELQRFLQDDDDMMKMCLTRKRELEHQLAAATSTPTNGAPSLDGSCIALRVSADLLGNLEWQCTVCTCKVSAGLVAMQPPLQFLGKVARLKLTKFVLAGPLLMDGSSALEPLVKSQLVASAMPPKHTCHSVVRICSPCFQ